MGFSHWPPLFVIDIEANGTNRPDLVEVTGLPIPDGHLPP